jgi:HK97 family phage prohead protease
MSEQVERRVLSVEAEFRAAADGKSISGYAARYNSLSGPIPQIKQGKLRTFRERLAPGAFRAAVDAKQDVTMLVQHDGDKLLGRTASGTLQLKDDAKGLAFRCSIPDTQLGRDTHELIKRGDLNACSFSFMLGERDSDWADEDIDDDEYDPADDAEDKKEKRKKTLVRTIRNVPKLYDVSVVTRPAYPNGTSVVARTDDSECRMEWVPKEISARLFDEFVQPPTQAASDEKRARRRNLLNSIL